MFICMYIYMYTYIYYIYYIYIYICTRNQCVYVLRSKNKGNVQPLTNFRILLILNHVCEW